MIDKLSLDIKHPIILKVYNNVFNQQVGKEFTQRMDLDSADYSPPDDFPAACHEISERPAHREAVVNACVYVHQTLHRANASLAKKANRTMAITPRYNNIFIPFCYCLL